MQLSVKGHNVDVGDSLRAHIEEKLEGISQKYFNRVTDIKVIFSRETQSIFKVNLTFHVGRDVKVQAVAENHDAYLAFDEGADRIAKQLRRYKRRLRDHHERIEKTPETAQMHVRDYILQAEGFDINEEDHPEDHPLKGEEPVIVAEAQANVWPMSVSEAVMRMDLANQGFMLFKNPKTDALNVVYRRSDGNIGWIDSAAE